MGAKNTVHRYNRPYTNARPPRYTGWELKIQARLDRYIENNYGDIWEPTGEISSKFIYWLNRFELYNNWF